MSKDDKKTKDTGKNLVNNQIQPFMSETNPRNPYGCNYEELEYETKVFYKYQEIKKHVHFSEQDQNKVIQANFMYMAGVTLSVLGSLGLGYVMKKNQVFSRLRTLHILAEEYTNFYYGFFVAASGSFSYFYCNRYYIQEVCKPLMMKYLEGAKENGFQDYRISETKPFDWEEKFLGSSKLPKKQ
ncbi:hypothetical protein ABPG72_011561 [Tetrahymena utriculariae]